MLVSKCSSRIGLNQWTLFGTIITIMEKLSIVATFFRVISTAIWLSEVFCFKTKAIVYEQKTNRETPLHPFGFWPSIFPFSFNSQPFINVVVIVVFCTVSSEFLSDILDHFVCGQLGPGMENSLYGTEEDAQLVVPLSSGNSFDIAFYFTFATRYGTTCIQDSFKSQPRMNRNQFSKN